MIEYLYGAGGYYSTNVSNDYIDLHNDFGLNITYLLTFSSTLTTWSELSCASSTAENTLVFNIGSSWLNKEKFGKTVMNLILRNIKRAPRDKHVSAKSPAKSYSSSLLMPNHNIYLSLRNSSSPFPQCMCDTSIHEHIWTAPGCRLKSNCKLF